jgi:hypothetical protein
MVKLGLGIVLGIILAAMAAGAWILYQITLID